MKETWETGLGSVTAHVVLNELGMIGSVAKTLQERWDRLGEEQRNELLLMIDEAAERGIDRLRTAVVVMEA